MVLTIPPSPNHQKMQWDAVGQPSEVLQEVWRNRERLAQLLNLNMFWMGKHVLLFALVPISYNWKDVGSRGAPFRIGQVCAFHAWHFCNKTATVLGVPNSALTHFRRSLEFVDLPW